MLGNNPGFVKDIVKEATEMLGEMLNTHKCLLKSGVEIQKRQESHPATKKMGIFWISPSGALQICLGDSSLCFCTEFFAFLTVF